MTYIKELRSKVTPEFLIFCWKDIKCAHKLKQKFYFQDAFILPISLSWFSRASSFVKRGKFNYSEYLKSYRVANSRFKSDKTTSNYSKYLVLQKAFTVLLTPYFSKYLEPYTFNLTGCLRIVY